MVFTTRSGRTTCEVKRLVPHTEEDIDEKKIDSWQDATEAMHNKYNTANIVREEEGSRWRQ